MSVPILPCDDHPDGRPPLTPNPSVPFANSYQWIGPDMIREVRVKEEAYAECVEGKGTSLAETSQAELEGFVNSDLWKCVRATRAREVGGAGNLQQGTSAYGEPSGLVRPANEPSGRTFEVVGSTSSGYDSDKELSSSRHNEQRYASCNPRNPDLLTGSLAPRRQA